VLQLGDSDMEEKFLQNLSDTSQVIFGPKAELKFDLPLGTVLLVVSENLDTLFLNEFMSYYENNGTEFKKLIKPSGEPWSDSIDLAFEKINFKVDGIVGIGGGSTLDFAKAISILIQNVGLINDYEFRNRLIESAVPLWFVPTTCGSGSELTQYTVINNSKTKRKFTLSNELLKPRQAAINPNLLRFITNQVRLESGLDAFTHCLEALLNYNQNKDLESVSKCGLTIARTALPRTLNGEESQDLFHQLCLMSAYGGASIARNRTGLIHTLSVAFSPFFETSHGRLNANLLKFALQYSVDNYNGQLQSVVSAMFEREIHSDHQAMDVLLNWLYPLLGDECLKKSITLDEHVEAIYRRVLQDAGLNSVTYGGIDKERLFLLVRKIVDEIR